MTTELLANNYTTTLSGNGGSINNSQQSFNIVGTLPAALQVAGGQSRVIVDQEIMIVPGGQTGPALAGVTRGAENTTPAAHNDGAIVAHVFTAGGVLGTLTGAASSVNAWISPSGSDDSAAVQAAIDALPAAGGTIVLGVGTFLWNTATVKLPRSKPVRIIAQGIGKTIIKLSSGAPRFLDFNKIADYDTFIDIEVSDLTVDCNSIGGRHHVVIGTYIGGAQTTRISVNNIALRRIRTINVPTDSTTTNHRLNVWIVPQVNTADTACTLNDHVYEDLDFMHGGNMGLVVGASATVSPSNCTYDRIYIRRVNHDTGTTQNPASTFSSSNIQVGSQAPGGHVVLEECYGANSGDVGIEIDNHSTCRITDCVMQDSPTAEWLFRTFAAPTDGAQKSTALLDNCEARVVNLALTESALTHQGTGFYIGNSADQQAGRFTLRHCKYVNTTANIVFGAAATPSVGAAIHTIGPVYDVSLERFKVIAESLAMTPADSQQPRVMVLNHGGTSTVKVKGLLIRLAGSKSGGAGSVSCRVFEPGGTAGGDDMTIHIEDYDLDMAVTGFASGYGILPGFQGGHLRGTIRRMRIISQGDANALSNYIFFSATPNLAPKVLIADCDFTNGLTNLDINIPAAQAPKVYLERNVWHTYPKASAAMSSSNFNTGTFTTATGNQYIGGYGATIQMTGGAGVTLIDLSKDGSAYDNVWTQASGALTQTVQFHVDNGDSVKITFATTQPVVRVLPDK